MSSFRFNDHIDRNVDALLAASEFYRDVRAEAKST